MTICCFPNCAYLSETSRMIAVYKKLVSMGENPLMATHGGTYEYLLEKESIPFKYVMPIFSHERSLEYVAANRGERGLYGMGYYKNDEELKQHVLSEIDFFRDNKVNVVLTGWTLSNVISTRVLGIPLCVTHLGSFVPPIIEKVGLISDRIPKVISSKIFYLGTTLGIFLKPFNNVAKELNVAPFKSILELWMGDLTLVTDCPEVTGIKKEDIENWKPNNPKLYSRNPKLKYVGAIYAKVFDDIPEDVKSFLDDSEKKVYVALTSSKSDYVSSVYSVLKDMKVKTILVTTVHKDIVDYSSNILIKKYLPSHKIMPLVDCAIIHGGQGSTQTAIASGTPLIGFPLHEEQYLNLKMIENRGAGICMPLKSIKKGNYRDSIKKILMDNSFKENMLRLKLYQEFYDGPENTAIVLKDLNNSLDSNL